MRLKRLVNCVIAASVLMSVFRTFTVVFYMEKNEFENDTYYLSDRPIVTGFIVLMFVLLAAILAFSLLIGRKKLRLSLLRGAAPVGSLVAAFSLIGTVFAYVMTVFGGEITFDFISVLVLVFTVLTAVKFLLYGFSSDEGKVCGVADAITSVFPIVFSAGRLVEEFMETNASPLASSGGYHIMGLSATMLFFLYEGKACVHGDRGAVFFLFGSLSVFFLLVYSVPNIILHCFGTFTFDTKAAFSIVDIGFAVYISARMRSARIVKA